MAPEIINFELSAPGKVILHGEHSVVYGKPAIAVAINSRNHLKFQENSKSDLISFNFVTLNKNFNKFTVASMNEILQEAKTVLKNSNYEPTSEVMSILKGFIETNLKVEYNDKDYQSLLSSIYLFCSILTSNDILKIENGFTLEIKSSIRIGAGLGSSASFAVCLAAAFHIFSFFRKNSHNVIDEIKEEEKELISKWALNSEKIIHGNPSGIDNMICTYGGAIKFTKGKAAEKFNLRNNFDILLVDSKIQRNTKNMLNKVINLREKYPNIVEKLFEIMEECVNEVEQVLRDGITPTKNSLLNGDNNETSEESFLYEKMRDLFRINNDLLRAIGVTHLKLEEIFLIAEKYDFKYKITGAGGGGYCIVLLPKEYKTTEAFLNFCKDLQEAKFGFFETTVGAPGLKIIKLEKKEI